MTIGDLISIICGIISIILIVAHYKEHIELFGDENNSIFPSLSLVILMLISLIHAIMYLIDNWNIRLF